MHLTLFAFGKEVIDFQCGRGLPPTRPIVTSPSLETEIETGCSECSEQLRFGFNNCKCTGAS